jgi:MSHA biogenesis protein MshK
MDEAVSPIARRASLFAALLAAPLLALPAAGTADAAPLNDPTRPPAAALPAAAGTSAGPQLQSVLVGRAPGGRRIAVIDGETVRQGDDFHGARVARVGDTEVELVRGRERQVLRLYGPGPAVTAATAAAAPAVPR